jgi:small subunit ribosomal protein S8
MVTDPISDFIIRLKNASDAKKASVVVIGSKLTESIAHALKKAGYISSVDKSKTKREIELGLVYFEGAPRINGVERISKPSRRLYQKAADIRTFKSGYGNTIFTTSKGIMTDADAKKSKLGGEILFRIW